MRTSHVSCNLTFCYEPTRDLLVPYAKQMTCNVPPHQLDVSQTLLPLRLLRNLTFSWNFILQQCQPTGKFGAQRPTPGVDKEPREWRTRNQISEGSAVNGGGDSRQLSAGTDGVTPKVTRKRGGEGATEKGELEYQEAGKSN